MTKLQKIFVTGGGGLIGSAVCAKLSSRGLDVVCLLLDGESDENVSDICGLEIIEGDVRDAAFLTRSMSGSDACIHLAALNKLWHRPVKDYRDINYLGTRNVCEAARLNGLSKFIHISSCEIMGRLGDGEVGSENTRIVEKNARGQYARSKYQAEEHVRGLMSCGFPATILRPTAVIGPGDIHMTPPGRLIRSYLSGELKVYFNARINITDSRDVANAAAAALTAPDGETYIIGSHNIEIEEILRRISKIAQIDRMPDKLGYASSFAGTLALQVIGCLTGKDPGMTPYDLSVVKNPWTFDSSKARRELGITPRSIDETLKDAVNWHRRR